MIASAAKAKFATAYMLAALSTCPAQKPIDHVDLLFTNKPPVITHDKSSRELGGYTISTTFAHSHNEMFSVGGLHISDFAPQYLITFALIKGLEGGKVCLAPDSVKISVEYAPKIMIASEFVNGSCRYRTTLDHEMRHVGIDIASLNEYLPKIKLALTLTAAGIQPVGPMPLTSLDKAKDIIVDQVRSSLSQQVEEFELVRLNRQQLIDTRAEYLRVSKLCQ